MPQSDAPPTTRCRLCRWLEAHDENCVGRAVFLAGAVVGVGSWLGGVPAPYAITAGCVAGAFVIDRIVRLCP